MPFSAKIHAVRKPPISPESRLFEPAGEVGPPRVPELLLRGPVPCAIYLVVTALSGVSVSISMARGPKTRALFERALEVGRHLSGTLPTRLSVKSQGRRPGRSENSRAP